MWITGKGNILIIIGVYFVFFRGGKPSSSTCCYGFVCEGEKLSHWWTGQASLDHITDKRRHRLVCSAQPEAWWPLCKQPCLQYPHFIWYNGTRTFSLYHSLTDLWCTRLADFHWSKPHLRLSFPCTAIEDTHQIDFTDWITLPVLCVCMFMCWQYVLKDIHGQQWQG